MPINLCAFCVRGTETSRWFIHRGVFPSHDFKPSLHRCTPRQNHRNPPSPPSRMETMRPSLQRRQNAPGGICPPCGKTHQDQTKNPCAYVNTRFYGCLWKVSLKCLRDAISRKCAQIGLSPRSNSSFHRLRHRARWRFYVFFNYPIWASRPLSKGSRLGNLALQEWAGVDARQPLYLTILPKSARLIPTRRHHYF